MQTNRAFAKSQVMAAVSPERTQPVPPFALCRSRSKDPDDRFIEPCQ